jgi:hypothetical protein
LVLKYGKPDPHPVSTFGFPPQHKPTFFLGRTLSIFRRCFYTPFLEYINYLLNPNSLPTRRLARFATLVRALLFAAMRMINTFFAVFFTLSLVSASPLGRLSNEKRQNDDNVVWVTVTSTSTVTIHTHTGKAPRATKTVTIHATFGEPPQRAQFINTPTVETPVANTPNAPVVAAAPVAASPTPVVPVTTPTAPAAAVVKGSTSNTGSTGTSFTGQGTFYSAG